MTYDEAQRQVFAHGTAPDGYFGDRASVGFALADSRIITVAHCGCFDSGLPPVVDVAEALWILKHHPTARHIRVTRVIH